jgi:glutamate/tyrosine decarboxylase-like PLP-dependent enzyme
MPAQPASAETLLGEIERVSRRLEPDRGERQSAIEAVAAYIQEYVDGLATAPAFFDRKDMGAGIREHPISEEGIGLERVLGLIEADVDTVGINTTSGRFLGYIPGGALFYSGLADWLAAATNRYASVFFASPGAVRIENQLLRWMADLIGYPFESAGYLAAGGSMANLTAIVTAREARALEGEAIRNAVVYTTDHAHHCIDKALRLSGLGNCIVRRIGVDAGYRMRVEALASAVSRDRSDGLLPFMIVASAGTTNTGSVDPLDEIADIAEAEDVWFHVDAAYGGFFILSPEAPPGLRAMARADSVVMDPHKTLFLPYGTGALLVRDGNLLRKAHVADADYLMDARGDFDEISPANVSPELTKHFRGLRLWLPLQVHGVAPFRAALTEKLLLARYFHERLSRVDGFEVGPEPDLSVVTYRYLPDSGDADAFNARLAAAVRADGRILITSTRLNGRLILRMAAVSFRTHRADVDTAVDVLTQLARSLEADDGN